MLNKLKKRPNIFVQRVHGAYNHDIRRLICIATGLTILLCKISLQFCCEFIDKNKSNIFLIRNVTRWAKFPTSILYIVYSAFNLYDLVKDYRGHRGKKKELAKIVGKSASLASSTIEALMMLKIFHFLTGSNASTISYIHLTSTVLFLFVAESIGYYYTYKKYQEVHKKYQKTCVKYQDKKKTDEFVKCEAELAKRRKSILISTLTLPLGLLNFVLRGIEIATKPINLGNGIIYNFNLRVTVSIIYSGVFLAIHLDKLFSQPINDDPSAELDSINCQLVNDSNNIDFI